MRNCLNGENLKFRIVKRKENKQAKTKLNKIINII